MGQDDMGLVARKPVFRFSNKARFKPACSATETSKKVENSHVASLDIILSKSEKTKALIRLCGCAGWSTHMLFTNPLGHVFSRRGPYVITLHFQLLPKPKVGQY